MTNYASYESYPHVKNKTTIKFVCELYRNRQNIRIYYRIMPANCPSLVFVRKLVCEMAMYGYFIGQAMFVVLDDGDNTM